MNEHQTHHWQRVREIFDRASELSGDARNLLVAELCAQEPSNIRNDVAKLLSIQKESGLAIDRPVLRPVKNAQVQKGDTLANGRYRLLRFVASGGMGEVYAAHDTQTGRHVAVKFLRQFSLVSAQQEQIRARFEREAKLAGQIHHPNVCRIDAVYMDEDPPFCIMDLLQGETLAARLASKGRYTPAEALPIVEKICEGLHAAHAAGIVHRDLKPGNVFLTANETDVEPMLIDFGLATALNRDFSLTKTGEVIGTLAYIAPELLEQGGGGTPASDIYSLGVILFEMLTGVKPHASESPLRLVMQKARKSDLSSNQAIQALGLPPVWLEAIQRCLASNPEDRFRGALEVRDRLRQGSASWRFHLSRRPVRMIAGVLGLGAAMAIGWEFWTKEYRPKPEAAQLYSEAKAAIREAAPSQASRLLEKAVQIDPAYLDAHSLLVSQYSETQQLDRAREQMLHAVEAKDKRWRVGRLESMMLAAARAESIRDFSQAASLYEDAERAGADAELARWGAARSHEQRGNAREAMKIVDRLIATGHPHLAASIQRATQLASSGKTQEAERGFADLEKAMQSDEGRAALLLARAIGLRREPAVNLRDVEQAKALAIRSGAPHLELRAVFREALIAVQMERFDEGIRIGTEGVARAQQLGMSALAARGQTELGYALYTVRKFSEAEQVLRNAFDVAQRSKSADVEAAARLRLGEVLFSPPGNRVAEGIAMMEPAIEWYRRSAGRDSKHIALLKWAGYISNDPARSKDTEPILQEVLAETEEGGDPTVRALVLQRLGSIVGWFDHRQGLAYWNRALPIARENNLPEILHATARQYGYAGQFDQQDRLLREAEATVADKPPNLFVRTRVADTIWMQRWLSAFRQGACPALSSQNLARYGTHAQLVMQARVAQCSTDFDGKAIRQKALNLARGQSGNRDFRGFGESMLHAALLDLALADYPAAEAHAREAIDRLASVRYRILQIEAELVYRKALLAQGKDAQQATAAVLASARAFGFPEPVETFGGRVDLQRLWSAERTVIMRPAHRP